MDFLHKHLDVDKTTNSIRDKMHRIWKKHKKHFQVLQHKYVHL